MPHTLAAEPRTELGRRAKQVRLSGKIPAVMYGHGLEPKAIQVKRSDFRNIYRDAGTSSLIDIAVEGEAPVKALIQDVQVHPVSLEPSHVDFHLIRMDEKVTVDVPLAFVGESKAVKELAGTLVVPKDTVEVECLPADLPREIEVDLSALDTFDDAITVGSLKLPKGVAVLDDPEEVIANVSRPLTEEELKKLEAEAAPVDVTAIKTEAEEKKATEEAKKAEEAAAEEASK